MASRIHVASPHALPQTAQYHVLTQTLMLWFNSTAHSCKNTFSCHSQPHSSCRSHALLRASHNSGCSTVYMASHSSCDAAVPCRTAVWRMESIGHARHVKQHYIAGTTAFLTPAAQLLPLPFNLWLLHVVKLDALPAVIILGKTLPLESSYTLCIAHDSSCHLWRPGGGRWTPTSCIT